MRILHLLNWRLEDVSQHINEIYEQGFDAVQINPIQPLKEEGFGNWWLPYQPCGFSIGNQYGSREDLKKLCSMASEYSVRVFADVICTHVAESSNGFLKPHEKVDKRLVDNPFIWRQKKSICNWDSRYEALNFCPKLPAFNLQNYDLQNTIIDFLNDLIDCGVRGFRFDSAKNIPTPREGCDFFPRVLGSLKRNDIYNYGEVIFANEELISMYSDYLDVLTNTWSRNTNNVVVFPESHDSYYEFKYTNKLSSKQITKDYEQLTEKYPKTIYFARPFDDEWKSEEVRNINRGEKCKVLVRR